MQNYKGLGCLDSGTITTTHLPANTIMYSDTGTDITYQPAESYSLTMALNSAGKIS